MTCLKLQASKVSARGLYSCPLLVSTQPRPQVGPITEIAQHVVCVEADSLVVYWQFLKKTDRPDPTLWTRCFLRYAPCLMANRCFCRGLRWATLKGMQQNHSTISQHKSTTIWLHHFNLIYMNK